MTARRSPVHLLVVDDDPMSRDLLSLLLAAEGYEVESAESGDAALALLAGSHPAPQVVLVDVQMPGTSGPRLARALRAKCGPATRLLAISGSGPTPSAIARFDGFLMKPFTMPQLAAAIDKAVTTTVTALAASAAPDPPTATSPSTVASNSSMAETAIERNISHLQAAETPAAGVMPAADSTTPLDSPLDERIYSQLADAMPAPQLHQMYGMCMKDARDRIAAMRGLAARHDHSQFVRQAHAIKGSCGMLGASELYGMAARLEKAGLDAPGFRAPQRGVNPLDELDAACDRLERILGSRV